MLTKPRWLLHLEGAAILFLTIILYAQGHFRWWLYAVLFLAPDLFMLGYLANARAGAAIYNLAHTLAAPLALLAIGLILFAPQVFPYGLIWLSHLSIWALLGNNIEHLHKGMIEFFISKCRKYESRLGRDVYYIEDSDAQHPTSCGAGVESTLLET